MTKQQVRELLQTKEAYRDELQRILAQAPVLLNDIAEKITAAMEADFCMFDTNLIKVNRTEKWCAAEVGISSAHETTWFLLIVNYDHPEIWRAWYSNDHEPMDLIQFVGYDEETGFHNTSGTIDIYAITL
ncbi:hypothetical protein [Paenibacillus glucanolyticus]|uniref:hypothetical protein n=1 Tax=Paenibacillus glucanolyticus TaxID=59843 RepID=UPI00128D69EA|nr:hypothetical protein [Paenibacillus glucanolyticus]MPY15815.1 hypothetical protein [Paenibacillus glucanolyticus]